jgi:hypothetical protein
MPVIDTVATPTVTYPVAGGILEPARIWQPPGLHPGTSQDMAATTARRHHKHILTSQILAKQDHIYRQDS